MNHEINIYETLISPFLISFSACMSSLPFIDFEIKKKVALVLVSLIEMTAEYLWMGFLLI